MTKRSVTLILFFTLLMTLAVGVAQAAVPFVNITSPANNTVLPDPANINVSVNFGNAPEPDANGSPEILVIAYDSGNNEINQVAGLDLSQIPAQLVLDASAAPSGSTGTIVAYMVDPEGNRVATSAAVPVTYGNAAPPPATSTPTPTPINTPTPTATSPASTQVFINTPTNGSTVNPNTAITVTGSGNSLTNTTVKVILFNSSNNELGEQSVVPNPDNSWSLTVTKTQNVPITATGSIIAYAMNGSTTVAISNPVDVNFSQPTQPAITIGSPTNGATIATGAAFSVTGSISNVPGVATVLVQAFVNGNPSAVAQQTVSPSGGNWTASLTVGVSNSGTQGTIIAYALSNNASVATSNTVSVFWGSSGVPAVQIISPPQGSIVGVNGAPIPVSGTSFNGFQNTVFVRALDSFGNILGQISATNFANTNNWQTQLFVNVTPGTPGSLLAYVTSVQNGAMTATSRVNVIFGGQCFIRTDWPIYVVQPRDTLLKIAQKVGSTIQALAVGNCIPNANIVYVGQQLHVPNPPIPTPSPLKTLNIILPAQNAQLDTTQPVSVAGNGLNLAGVSIVVRALDANGNVLAQQTTIGSAMDSGGNSQWQVNLSIPLDDGSHGTIYAFAQSSANTILADALVNVTFGNPQAVVVTPVQRKLVITSPTDNALLPQSGQLQVTGQILGPFEGDLYIRILDNQGVMIGEAKGTISPADNQGNSTWQVTLPITLQNPTRGIIFAYLSSPFDTAALISDGVNVIFGQPTNEPFVTITDPLPYSTLDSSQPLAIAGTAQGVFQGALVVRALDTQGNVLAETPTTLNTANGGVWQAALTLNNVPKGTGGTIVVFAQSAQNSGTISFASVPVTFGDATTTANFVRINTPLPGSLVDPSQTLMIAGTADRTNSTSVKVQILDDQGNVLVEQPRNLTQSESGNFGVWQMLIALRGMTAGTHLRVNAILISKVDGSALATDSVDFIVGTPPVQGS